MEMALTVRDKMQESSLQDLVAVLLEVVQMELPWFLWKNHCSFFPKASTTHSSTKSRSTSTTPRSCMWLVTSPTTCGLKRTRQFPFWQTTAKYAPTSTRNCLAEATIDHQKHKAAAGGRPPRGQTPSTVDHQHATRGGQRDGPRVSSSAEASVRDAARKDTGLENAKTSQTSAAR